MWGDWYEWLGMLGVLLVLGSYFLLQLERVSSQHPAYSAANAAGAGLILVSLYFDFNLSAFIVEIFWLLASLLGLIRQLRATATP